MTTVYFVRHAESNNDNRDERSRELTQKGLTDSGLVTDYLLDKNIDAILSSPYKRAVDTLNQLADLKGLVAETHEGFREREVGGVSAGGDFAARQWGDFSYKNPGGESLSEVQERNIAALNEALKQYENKTIAIGSHGTALSTVVNYFDSSFGYDDFIKIKGLMPWIVKIVFDGDKMQSLEMIDVFAL